MLHCIWRNVQQDERAVAITSGKLFSESERQSRGAMWQYNKPLRLPKMENKRRGAIHGMQYLKARRIRCITAARGHSNAVSPGREKKSVCQSLRRNCKLRINPKTAAECHYQRGVTQREHGTGNFCYIFGREWGVAKTLPRRLCCSSNMNFNTI